MFMRLMGYPAANISILTTYNGQRALISDVRKDSDIHNLDNSNTWILD
jgi:hypothetical protein